MFDQDFVFGHCTPPMECYINKSAVQDLITDHLNSMLYLRISKLWRKENHNLEGACNFFVWRRFHFDQTAHLAFVCGKDDDRRCMHHAHPQRPPAILLPLPLPVDKFQSLPFPCMQWTGQCNLGMSSLLHHVQWRLHVFSPLCQAAPRPVVSYGPSPTAVEPPGFDEKGFFIAFRSDPIDTSPKSDRDVPRHSSSFQARNARRHRVCLLLRRRRSAEEVNRKERRRDEWRNEGRKPRTKGNVQLRLVSEVCQAVQAARQGALGVEQSSKKPVRCDGEFEHGTEGVRTASRAGGQAPRLVAKAATVRGTCFPRGCRLHGSWKLGDSN